MTVQTIYLAALEDMTKLKVVTEDAGVHLLDGPAGVDAAEVQADVAKGEFEFLNSFPAVLMQSSDEDVAEWDETFPNAVIAYQA